MFAMGVTNTNTEPLEPLMEKGNDQARISISAQNWSRLPSDTFRKCLFFAW